MVIRFDLAMANLNAKKSKKNRTVHQVANGSI